MTDEAENGANKQAECTQRAERRSEPERQRAACTQHRRRRHSAAGSHRVRPRDGPSRPAPHALSDLRLARSPPTDEDCSRHERPDDAGELVAVEGDPGACDSRPKTPPGRKVTPARPHDVFPRSRSAVGHVPMTSATQRAFRAAPVPCLPPASHGPHTGPTSISEAAAPPSDHQQPPWANAVSLSCRSRKGVQREAVDPLPRLVQAGSGIWSEGGAAASSPLRRTGRDEQLHHCPPDISRDAGRVSVGRRGGSSGPTKRGPRPAMGRCPADL